MFNIFSKKEKEKDKGIEINEGDMLLGIDTITKKAVKIPLSDRYCHTLVTGSSGTAKSQFTLLPSIKRDIACSNLGVTFMDSEPYFTDEIYSFAKKYNKTIFYLNPENKHSPYLNILKGKEHLVVEIWVSVFKAINSDYSLYYDSRNERLIRQSLKIIKRTYGDNATLIDLDNLLNNRDGESIDILTDFSNATRDDKENYAENEDIFNWFVKDYLESKDLKKDSIFNDTSEFRRFVRRMISNPQLRNIFIPDDSREEFDFEKAFENGYIMCVNTDSVLLRELSYCLGYFAIENYRACMHDRPGNAYSRLGNMLYLKSLERFLIAPFSDMLSEGRSRAVAIHGFTKSRECLPLNLSMISDKKLYVEMMDSLFQNKIIYNGDIKDSIYYSNRLKDVVDKGKFSLPKNFDISILDPDAINNRAFGEFTYCVINDVHHALPSVAHAHPSYINKDVLDKKED